MAGTRTPPLYCWSWRIGELKIYGASSERGAFRVFLSLRDEGRGSDYFKAGNFSERLEENKSKNRALISAVEAALYNRPVSPDLPMDIHGTPFQWRAWEAAARIPFGMTKTYGQVAAMIGKTGGARAAGRAMGRNPLPLVFA
jgi:methylated-DNA-[protein]-cysteine S-methyltransferase